MRKLSLHVGDKERRSDQQALAPSDQLEPTAQFSCPISTCRKDYHDITKVAVNSGGLFSLIERRRLLSSTLLLDHWRTAPE
jgi:hypothetical protein